MKLGEFARRARASRLERKAKHEAAFQRAIRDLDLPATPPAPPHSPAPVSYLRGESARPALTFFPQRDSGLTRA